MKETWEENQPIEYVFVGVRVRGMQFRCKAKVSMS